MPSTERGADGDERDEADGKLAWLQTSVSLAIEAAKIRSQRFIWRPQAGATTAEIDNCQGACGVVFCASHTRLLREMNGAEFVLEELQSHCDYGVRLLPTYEIAELLPKMKSENDRDVGFKRHDRYWRGLIPVFDLMDATYLMCEADRQIDGDFELFYADVGDSPEEWRHGPAFAPNAIDALHRFFDEFVRSGSWPPYR